MKHVTLQLLLTRSEYAPLLPSSHQLPFTLPHPHIFLTKLEQISHLSHTHYYWCSPRFPLQQSDLGGLTWTRKLFEVRNTFHTLWRLPLMKVSIGPIVPAMSQIPTSCCLLPIAHHLSPMVNCSLFYHLLIAPSPVSFNLNIQRYVSSASNALSYDWCCSLISTMLNTYLFLVNCTCE